MSYFIKKLPAENKNGLDTTVNKGKKLLMAYLIVFLLG